MAPSDPVPARIFDKAAHGGAATRLIILMILSGLTEGVGVIILVPILESMDKTRASQPGLVLSAIGLPNHLETLLAAFIGLVALRAVITHWREVWALRLESAVVDRLRLRAWQGLVQCEWRALLKMEQGRAASLLVSRVEQAGAYVNQGLRMATTGATLFGLALAAFAIEPRFAVAAASAGALLLYAVQGTRRRATALGQAMGQAYAGIHAHIDEGVTSLRATKSLGREDLALSRLDSLLVRLRDTREAFQRDLGHSQIVLQCGGALILATLVWFALREWGLGVTLILPMVAISVRLLPLLGELQQAIAAIRHNRPAALETLDLIEFVERFREADDRTMAPPTLRNAVVLERIGVSLDEGAEAILHDVSAVIPATGITVVVGASGAGKSTLADVIGGLLTPDRGRLTVDSMEISGSLRQAWRRRVAYVQQEPILLSATLRANLLWADPAASDDRLTAALREASADFALTLPQGLDTPLGDGGRLLSGGERQRLMLARALLREPALLILDEATSALDSANEAQIATAVQRLSRRMAVVVISHRGALLALADQTISLDSGRIAQDGGRAGAAGDDA